MQALLHGVRLLNAVVFRVPCQLDRPATTRLGRADTVVVLAQAAFEIPGAAHVVAGVGAPHDVDVRHAMSITAQDARRQATTAICGGLVS